jgi:hypothetical protein
MKIRRHIDIDKYIDSIEEEFMNEHNFFYSRQHYELFKDSMTYQWFSFKLCLIELILRILAVLCIIKDVK